MKKTILFISPTGTLDNGGEISIFHLMKYLVSLGHQVINVGPDYTHPSLKHYQESFAAIAVKTYMLPAVKWWWREAPGTVVDEKEYAYNHRAIISAIREIIRQNGVNLVISNTVNVSQGSIAAAIENVPHFWLIHEFPENEFEYYKSKIDFIDSLSDEIFSVEGNLNKTIASLFPKREVRTFIPYSEIKIHTLKKGKKTRLVNIGRVSDRKNQLELIKAFEKVEDKNLELLIIGEDREEEMGEICRRYIKDRKIEKVTFLGNQANPWDFVTDKDIFITPSKTETFGLVVIEAMVNGVPVIMSENPGHDTVYDIFKSGLRYPLGKISQLTEKIEDAVANFESLKQAALLQVDKVKRIYKIEHCYEQIVAQISKDYSKKAQIINPIAALISSNAEGGFFSRNIKKGAGFRRLMNKIPFLNSHKGRILRHQVKKLLTSPRYWGHLAKKIVKKAARPLFLLKTKLYQLLRDLQRPKAEDPRRILVYVIYEDQARLQTYKLIFLKALRTLVDEAVIVVNGSLPEADIASLQEYGKVEFRKNQGYDVAAFRYGIQSIGRVKLDTFDELLLVNDTNVGPLLDLEKIFEKADYEKIDFWGISYGEAQEDVTGYNPYGRIPKHLQSYFLVIKKNLLKYPLFYRYWESLDDTDSREKAIGRYETVFTKKFEDKGFRHLALTDENYDSAMYIHPFEMVKSGVPLVKFSAFLNDTDEVYEWQGLERETEIPKLLDYIKTETDYPMSAIDEILDLVAKKKQKKKDQPYVLIIDGVENQIPQCTIYRVLNKAEQIRSFGYEVKVINASDFLLSNAQYASHVIIYRTGYRPIYEKLHQLCRKYEIPLYYDIDDLVFDTKYTDQLQYTQNLSPKEKRNYDAVVNEYGRLLKLCDGAITTTSALKKELGKYGLSVLLNRNLANQELLSISQKVPKKSSDKVKIGYFSGSISHNENFELIKAALIRILEQYPQAELHLVGHLNIPQDIQKFGGQIVTHDYVDWRELPKLIAEVDINLAPLVTTTFNAAKSEIKWIEAALVKVVTLASNVGAYQEMIRNEETGLLVNDEEWEEKLRDLIVRPEKRSALAEAAEKFVLAYCVTDRHQDDLTGFLRGKV